MQFEGKQDITNYEYHTGQGISQSALKYIRRSPKHYWAKFISDRGIEDNKTRAKQLGTDVHCALLEPDLFAKNYIIIPEYAPKKPSSTQVKAKNPSLNTIEQIEWWDGFIAKAGDKTIITQSDWDTCVNIRETVLNHPVAGVWFESGKAEQTFYGVDPDTGLLLKCRPDFMNDNGVMIDLKKTVNASTSEFGRSAGNYGYHIQAAFYVDLLTNLYGDAPDLFIFVAVEEEFPHAVNVLFIDEDDMETGRTIYKRNLMKISECLENNHWPDYCDTEMNRLWLPAWVKSQS